MILEKKLPFGLFLNLIKKEILIVSMIYVLISLLATVTPEIQISPSIPGLLGTAISLVLAFKLAQSYDRWWEARKIWGAIVNDSRSLVLELLKFARTQPNGETLEVIQRIAFRQIAWCYSTGQWLRKEDSLAHLDGLLSDADLNTYKHAQHKPLCLTHMIDEDLAKLSQAGAFNDFQEVQLDATQVRLVASLGKAERIKNTIFPKFYRIFTRFFVYVFLITLYLALVNIQGYWEMLIAVGVAIPFFLLQKSAFLIQDPFEGRMSDIPVTSIAHAIDQNLREIIGAPKTSVVLPNYGYYVL